MNEVNEKFYVLLNLDKMKFVRGYHKSKCGVYTIFACKAKQFPNSELAENAKQYYKERDKLVVKEVQVIVSNMP